MVLAIYGAGGLGKEIYDTVSTQMSLKWNEVVYIDDADFDGPFYGTKVFSLSQILSKVGVDDLRIIIGVGEPSIREKLFSKICEFSVKAASIIHPSAIVSPTSTVGQGVYIGPYSFISSNAQIANNVLIQPHAMIGHDVVVGCSSVISTNAVIAGDCSIGERTYVALNVSVEQNVKIGDDTIVGMASCVNKNIPSEVIAMGYPARVLKTNERKKVF